MSTASGSERRRILEECRLGRVLGERRATIPVLRRFRRVIRRRIERSDANHPCRDASSSGSDHRTAAQVGHVLEIQPRADLASI